MSSSSSSEGDEEVSRPDSAGEDNISFTPSQQHDGEKESSAVSNKKESTTSRVSRGFRLSQDERCDLVASLEHIVTVGSVARNTAHRQRKSLPEEIRGNDEKDLAELDKASVQLLERSGVDLPDDLPPRMLHAQDIRIYGVKGFDKRKWPSKQETSVMSDEMWHQEHGDGVHPLAFSDTRLSRAKRTSISKRQRVDDPILSMNKTENTIEQHQVARAMLLRCWDRAVHAASTVIPLESSQESVEAVSVATNDGNDVYSPETAQTKCQSLGIELPRPFEAQVCPTCGTDFNEEAVLQRHFVGASNHRGCCWTLIRDHQLDLLDSALQNEVAYCGEKLMQSFVSACERESRDSHDNDDDSPKTWRDVLRLLETAIKAQFEAASRLRNAQQLSQADESSESRFNLLSNQQILQAVSGRLVERYADTPR